MKSIDKIPKHLPCSTCLVLAICINKTLSNIFDECPILQEWYKNKTTEAENGIPRDSIR
jgi:hypothetical protein